MDQHGIVLDEILQRRRDKDAARRLLVRLLKKQRWRPRRIVTDRLPSYSAARREIAPGLEHRAHKALNNPAENSHVPFRKRERQMQGFRSPGGLQRFVSVLSALRNHFVPPASRRSALATRLHRLEALDLWGQAPASPPEGRGDQPLRPPRPVNVTGWTAPATGVDAP